MDSARKRHAVVVGTWAFSAEPVKVAARLVSQGCTCEDSVENALNLAEEDEKYGPFQVGRGGPPNQNGELEMDAAIMSGKQMSFGAVTALQGISRASSVARCVMERSKHSMLTAQGAQDFAVQSGFHLDILNTQSGDGASRIQSSEHQAKSESSSQHDTLGIIVLDSHGNIATGVTSSGMKNKARGRIGDSALPGSGLFADNEVGAVCCSGEGDQIMKFCPSFMVLELMRQGMEPETACQTAIRRITKRVKPSPPFELAIIAVNMEGKVGAATTVKEWGDTVTGRSYPGFPFAVWSGIAGEEPQIRSAQPET
ncbi:hypothetical protein V1264_002362 [Littorina saxatilis]|uniref:Uncharacterized protein n=1 Tax=Littorina saxatilis TaxID=31220 RepID=A0AAN9GPX4_9CAEN